MSENSNELSYLFIKAVEIQSETERQEFVQQLCLDTPELGEQLQILLDAHGRVGSFLARPLDPLAATEFNVQAGSGDALAMAHTSGASVLNWIGKTAACELPRVMLDSSADEVAVPLVRPKSQQLPSLGPASRYQLHGEIARGGMGAILKGRDTDLGRDLAIKVLLDEHRGKPAVVQRFVEEAQIGGQLQHPGIAPVYELGQFSDQRPYFSMKLVKGKTLSALLKERESPETERGKFLGIFEQICQTMAYAHSRGVIHRDLKPSNVMVGAFGEVQVMDWGLAKVLSAGGVADEKRAFENHTKTSIIHTIRSLGSDTPAGFGSTNNNAHTQMGSVLGTPAYMPPEQALGEIDRLDERSDVFGLGAILCEILTGAPPYTGDNHTEVFRKASRAKLEECLERLESPSIDAELRQIVVEALQPEPEDRYRDAGALAQRISGYIESVETRMRDVELARVAADARANEEHKRRRVTIALATSMLLTMGLVGAGYMYIQSQQAELAAVEIEQRHASQIQRTKLANQISSELATARALIKTESDDGLPDPSSVQRASEAAQRAKKLLAADEHAPSLHQAANELVSHLGQLQRDQKLIQDLEIAWHQDLEYRAQRNWRETGAKYSADRFNEPTKGVPQQPESEVLVLPPAIEPEKAYRAAFTEWGLDLKTNSIAEAVQQLGKLREALKPTALASLDRWSSILQEPWTIEKWQHAEWHNLQPIELISRGGDKLTVLEDQSILASGENAWAGYDLVFDTNVTELSALRLETLLHSSLPNLGPGRDILGRFGVFGLKVEYAPQDAIETKTRLLFDSAIADHSWRDRPITINQWHIGRGGGQPHAAIFKFATTIRSTSGFRIWISHQDRARDRWANENFGRFRWSASRASSSLSEIEQLQQIVNLADPDPWRQAVRQDLKSPNIVALSKRLSDTQEVERQPIQLLTHLAASLSMLKGNTLLAALPKSIRWSDLENLSVEPTNGSVATIQEDGTVLITGPNPDSEKLRIRGSLASQRITGLKLDLISTPNKTAWARRDSVRFREISARLRDSDGATKPLRPSFITSNHPGARTLDVVIDGNSDTSTQLLSDGDSAAIIVGVDSHELNPQQFLELEIDCGGLNPGTISPPGKNIRHFKVSVTGDELMLTDVRNACLNILQRMVKSYPTDYWARLALIDALMERSEPQPDEAVRHATAAIALRPEHSGGYAAMLRSIPLNRLADNPAYQQTLRDSTTRLQSIDARHSAIAETASNFELTISSMLAAPELDSDQLATLVSIVTDMQLVTTERYFHWSEIAKKLETKSNKDLARKIYERVVECAPRLWEKGMYYSRLGEKDKAIEHYRRSLELNPDHEITLVLLEAILFDTGEVDEALLLSRKLVTLYPTKYFGYWSHGRCLSKKGRHQEAESILRAGLEKSTDDRDKSLQHDLAYVLDELGRYRESIELAKSVGETSSNVSWLSNVALLLLQTPDKSLRDPRLAEEFSRKAVKLDPKYRAAQRNLGISLRDQDKLTEAEAALRLGLEQLPEDAQLKFELARVLDKLTPPQSRESIELRKSAIDAATDVGASELNRLAWQLLTIDEESLRDPKWAVEISQRAVKLSPTGVYLNTLGVAHYRAGNWQAAIESLNQSIDSAGEGFAYNAFFLAMAHWQLQYKEEALGWYEKGVQWLKENGEPAKDRDFDRNSGKAEAEQLLGIID